MKRHGSDMGNVSWWKGTRHWMSSVAVDVDENCRMQEKVPSRLVAMGWR